MRKYAHAQCKTIRVRRVSVLHRSESGSRDAGAHALIACGFGRCVRGFGFSLHRLSHSLDCRLRCVFDVAFEQLMATAAVSFGELQLFRVVRAACVRVFLRVCVVRCVFRVRALLCCCVLCAVVCCCVLLCGCVLLCVVVCCYVLLCVVVCVVREFCVLCVLCVLCCCCCACCCVLLCVLCVA